MKKIFFYIFVLLLLVALFFTLSTMSYNLFHIIIEFSTVMIGFIVYLIALITIRNEKSSNFRHFGIGLITVSVMIILHTLTYKGLNIIPGYDSNLPTQLWICSNIILVVNLFIATVTLDKNTKVWKYYTVTTVFGILLTIACFSRIFPDCYIEGTGITTFKIMMEYVIIGIYMLCLVYLLLKKQGLSNNIKATFISTVVLLAVSEFAFTLYADVYGILNFTGHFLRLIAFVIILIYAIKVNINNPFDALISDLKDSELQFNSIFEDTNTVMLLIDPGDGRIVLANPAASDFYGWSVEELSQMNINQINTLPYKRIAEEMKVAKTHLRSVFNFEHKLANGQLKNVIVNSSPVVVKGRNLLYSIIIDNTERLTAEKLLTISENNFKLMFLDAPLPYQSLNEEGFIIKVNKAWLELLGFKEKTVIGKWFGDFIDANMREEFMENFHKLKQIELASFNLKMQNKLKEQLIITFIGRIGKKEDGSFNQAHCILQDITLQKKIESEREETQRIMTQSQRLESIGMLAGGVAHEINNPINGIMNYGQIIMDNTDNESELHEFAKEIISETNRVANIVRNLLDFSRQTETPLENANPKDILDETLLLARTLLKRDQITLNLDMDSDLPYIKCISQQIQQVLMNVITNARDALNEKYIGYNENKIINIYVRENTEENEKYIRITIEDFGAGIKDIHKDKIFEPFYTTKDRFKGTGLGLSISHGIIKDHNGSLSFESEPGKFTRFIIDLPTIKKSF